MPMIRNNADVHLRVAEHVIPPKRTAHIIDADWQAWLCQNERIAAEHLQVVHHDPVRR